MSAAHSAHSFISSVGWSAAECSCGWKVRHEGVGHDRVYAELKDHVREHNRPRLDIASVLVLLSAVWLLTFGIWPLANPEHDTFDLALTWADWLAHGVGALGVIVMTSSITDWYIRR